MWCFFMSDFYVGRASIIEIFMLFLFSNACGNVMGSVNINVVSFEIRVFFGLCKFYGGWGFGNGVNLEFFVNGFGRFFLYLEGSI